MNIKLHKEQIKTVETFEGTKGHLYLRVITDSTEEPLWYEFSSTGWDSLFDGNAAGQLEEAYQKGRD
jgi:hypothetical protein